MVKSITINNQDPYFPTLLKTIPEPPTELVLKSLKPPAELWHNKLLVSIVGTRKPTAYGKKTVQWLVPALVRQKATIISGLAFGIDTLVHQTALKHQGRTIAILPRGIEESDITPQSNYSLSQQIIQQNGALLAEKLPPYPETTVGIPKWLYPRRNRLIAGISPQTIVIEATIKSGTMLTAQQTIDCGHNLWTIPGDIFNIYAQGPHKLISEGANPLINLKHFIESLHQPQTTHPLRLEKEILDFLKKPQYLLSILYKFPNCEDTLLNLKLTNQIDSQANLYFLKNNPAQPTNNNLPL